MTVLKLVTSEEVPSVAVEVSRLRAEVWAESGMKTPVDVGYGPGMDEDDFLSDHWLAYEEESLIASARLSVHEAALEIEYYEDYPPVPAIEGRIGYLARLVVKRSWKNRRGAAAQMDEWRFGRARELGCAAVLAAVTPWRVAGMMERGYSNLGKIRFSCPSRHVNTHYVPTLMHKSTLLDP